MDFDPARAQAFMDPYQQAVTNEALKEIDRQSQMASNQLAGQAVKAGAFGGSRFGIQQSELARNAADLKSRRIFEDLSRNYQQAQQAAQAANQQRLQQGQLFGQLGTQASGIGGAMAGLGAQQQQLAGQDVSQLLGIGGMQQQLAQTGLNTAYQNQLAMQNAPFQQLSSAAGILQQLSPQVMGQQVTAPLPQTNPFAQAAGLLATGAGGLGALMGN
jgi:DNA anti-recombination protein RmuC